MAKERCNSGRAQYMQVCARSRCPEVIIGCLLKANGWTTRSTVSVSRLIPTERSMKVKRRLFKHFVEYLFVYVKVSLSKE